MLSDIASFLFETTLGLLPLTMNTVFLSMVMVSAPIAGSRIVQGKQCEADHECGKGMYCYDSQLCTPCTNCSVYNRNKPPEYPLCPKSAQQCGQCLKGYMEEILTDGSRRDMCQPIIVSHTSAWIQPLIYTAIIATFVLSCSGVVLYIRWKKGRNGSNYSSEHPCGDPPPYIEGNSPLIQHEPTTTEATITIGDVMEMRRSFHCSKDRLNQQAIPYRNPDPPYGSGGEMDGPDLNGAVLDDNEDTVPSVWAPPPNYDNSSSSSTRSSSMVSLPEPFTDEDENEINNNDSGTSEAGELHRPFGMFATSSSLPTVATPSEPAAACSTHSLDEDVTYAQAPKRPRMTADSGTASMNDIDADNVEKGTPLNLQVNVYADIHIVQNNVNIDT